MLFGFTEREPITELQQKKLTQKIKKASVRFYKKLMRPTPPPTIFRLILFRMSRTNVQLLAQKYYDYQYYKEKGWIESDYYYDTSVENALKQAQK